ncbi:DNA repair protein RecN [Flaviaesturariibacter flavus]|uniref:DNA repair protein RecN n=1 Tax=Flaviaesturariibacter flavus TaxID=2502780 RepID=A0A4R1BBU2_9BACT|nr:DNA repair protein RecN [Flaviaesturariibacter flavus]TCJ14480.1 DNA repair protein RecN [Flaviaesturariibacter flavus]
MLCRLSIQNYAIIDQLEVDFSQNLNIITGETGAGKSILLGALGLILGRRADAGALLQRDKKCVVEGTFNNAVLDEAVLAFLQEQELDVQDEMVVRREIAPSGKSRAFVNDTPVNLTQLNHLSSLLVDLHQQFDTLELGESDFQRAVLDALAGNRPTLKQYAAQYAQLQEARRRLSVLQEQKAQFSREFDYHQFQYNELEEAGFRENELEDLDRELKVQTNAEGIKNALSKAYYELEEGETPMIRCLRSINSGLQPFRDLHPDLPALAQRIESAYIELQDIADELDRINGHVNSDAATIEQINERLSLGYKLMKKHGAQTTAELLAIKAGLEEKLQAVLNIDQDIETGAAEVARLEEAAGKLARTLSDARTKQVAPLEKKVNVMLAQVGMPNARLQVSVQPGTVLLPHGIDEIEFLFDANKSNQFQPLRKVASGGELSRLMLCIKSLVATSMNLPTLIFDEIDTGISGEAAKQVGIILKELAAARQVICITHQPQIAGKGDRHFFVYKAVHGETVKTGIRILSTDERVVAIAKMLSGEKPTAAALENAREMVMN